MVKNQADNMNNMNNMKWNEEDLRELIGEAIGEASMCWEPSPSFEVFNDVAAIKIVKRVVKTLLETANIPEDNTQDTQDTQDNTQDNTQDS